MTISKIFTETIHIEDIELYLIIFLLLFTLWFVLNTIKYYRGEKRKIKHLHRFAREGESLSQYELAKRYADGDLVRKSIPNATSLSQKAALSGNEKARDLLEDLLKKRKY